MQGLFWYQLKVIIPGVSNVAETQLIAQGGFVAVADADEDDVEVAVADDEEVDVEVGVDVAENVGIGAHVPEVKVKPTLHSHSVRRAEDFPEYPKVVGHELHELAPLVENVPSGQLLQQHIPPEQDEYVPAVQGAEITGMSIISVEQSDVEVTEAFVNANNMLPEVGNFPNVFMTAPLEGFPEHS